MTSLPRFRRVLLAALGAFCLGQISASAAMIVKHFGADGTDLPQVIESLQGTVYVDDEPEIQPLTIQILPDLGPGYHAIESSVSDLAFVRHFVQDSPLLCYYWFRATEDPYQYTDTMTVTNAYWMGGGAFVDNAIQGADNFVLLKSNITGEVVGVFQFNLDASDSANLSARLVAYAVNLDGLTYAQGVAAIQAVPEPSTVALLALAAIGGGYWRLRRQTRA